MWWMLTGLLVGFVGALVGAGGGFLLMPVLLLAYRLPPPDAAAVSLVAVTAASLSGTITYARQGQVDFHAGLTLALFAIPGSMLGARLAGHAPLGAFSWLFGLLLAAMGLWMAVGRGSRRRPGSGWVPVRHRPAAAGANLVAPLHACMVVVGGLASLFGIGGGPLVVPLLALGGGMEAHRAAATSQLIILLSSLAGVAGYALGGRVSWGPAAALAVGAMLGAPLGAGAGLRLDPRRLLQILGLCLLLVGMRIMWR
ncbi:MAG TPA: sulfite exporter TauE/SafE family protein [Symbiobacteriaceae bacterium]|nr:sulfite exporter TauE/SafE family protein [Symbiobacteriaceae bacterium]